MNGPIVTSDVIIVGAGFGGLSVAIALTKQGKRSFVVLEKSSGLGGTWRDNTYPGAACDVPSHLYSYSFEIKSDWSRMYAEQPEILGYLERCAERYGLGPHLRFGVEVTGASFDEARGTWTVETSTGERHVARALVVAVGQLNRPLIPKLKGLETFEGTMFHSARWDHTARLAGQRVGVIGTGASAIQFVPEVAKEAQRLTVFQRSPPYILPKLDRTFADAERWVFGHLPFTQSIHRALMYAWGEFRYIGLAAGRRPNEWLKRVTTWHLERSVQDPTLRAALTPDYPPGCKRILISNDYYPALCRSNVELVTDPLIEITPRGATTKSGRHHELDAIILGTGFRATELLAPMDVRGLGGRRLADEWKQGAEAYLGVTTHGFPNLFMLYGPNTNLGHNSILVMIEAQTRYIMSGLGQLFDGGLRTLNVRADVQQRFNAELVRRLEQQVFQGGCTSWYKTESGKNTNNWPGLTLEYRLRTRRLALRDYERM